ncbi:hypothetical protein GCM10026982_38410 [Nocardiopsis aegyptia]
MSESLPEGTAGDRFGPNTNLTVVHEIFLDVANNLAGEYAHRFHNAATAEEKSSAKAAILSVRRNQRAVDPTDRETMIAEILRMEHLIERLGQE